VLCKRHGKPCKLTGVEGSREFCAYALEHLSENGIGSDFRIRHAVAGIDRQPKFFKTDTAARNDWGATPAKETQDGYTRVECVTLEDVLADYSLVDFVHFDVQGAELEIFQDQSSRNTARMKAKRLVVGTHSRFIEASLLELLKSDGWILEGEKPCRFNYNTDLGYTEMTYIDGCQLWRNPRLCP
jgi:FkbM family methyltransferase